MPLHGLAVNRMLEAQMARMQTQLAMPLTSAIKAITHNRRAQAERMRSVQAQLMGPPGHRLKLHASANPILILAEQGSIHHHISLQDPPVARPHLAMLGVIDLPRAIIWIEPKGQLNRPPIGHQSTIQHRNVTLVHATLFKQLRSPFERLGMQRK